MESQVLWGLSPAPGPEGAPVAALMRQCAKRSRATRSRPGGRPGRGSDETGCETEPRATASG